MGVVAGLDFQAGTQFIAGHWDVLRRDFGMRIALTDVLDRSLVKREDFFHAVDFAEVSEFLDTIFQLAVGQRLADGIKVGETSQFHKAEPLAERIEGSGLGQRLSRFEDDPREC